MKNSKSKMLLIASLILIMLVSILQIKSLATNSDMLLIIKGTDNTYLIYVEELLNKDFEFAFSNNENGKNLNYIASAKDSEGNSIAYVNDALRQSFFNSENTYIWVKTNDNIVVNGEKISLDNVKTIEQLKTIENVTNRITVKSDAEEDKIEINGNQNKKYFYQVFVQSSSERYDRLLNLADKIVKYDENTNVFEKMRTYNEFYDLYYSLVSELDNNKWAEAKNMEIIKPYDAKDGEQYILWLKDSNNNIDIQFLTAYKKEIKIIEEKEKIEEVVTALPVTYDDITVLVISLGIVGLAIVAVVVYKIKTKKDRA